MSLPKKWDRVPDPKRSISPPTSTALRENKARPSIQHGALWLPTQAIRLSEISRVVWSDRDNDQYAVRVYFGVSSVLAGEFPLISDAIEWAKDLMQAVWQHGSAR